MADVVYPAVVGAALAAFKVMNLKVEVTGSSDIPRGSGAVVVINHISYVDFILAGYAMRQLEGRLVRFMAKDEVFRHKVSGPLMRGMHHIPVDRSAGAGSYRHAVRALQAGELVGVFPEATISRSFELKEFKTGAARMAAEADVPLLPVVLWGTQRIKTKSQPEKARRGLHVQVHVGPALPRVEGEDSITTTERLRAQMAETLARLRAEHPARQGDGEPDWWVPAADGGSAPTPTEAAQLDLAEAEERRARRAARAKP